MGYGLVGNREGARNRIGSRRFSIGRVPSFGHGCLEEGDGFELLGGVRGFLVMDFNQNLVDANGGGRKGAVFFIAVVELMMT